MQLLSPQNSNAHDQQKHCARMLRSWAMIKSAFLAGFLIGGYYGGQRANIRHLAEQQHAFGGIKTRREAAAWVRRRNSVMAVGVAREGLKRGGQLAMVAGVFEIGRWMMAEFRERQLISDWEFVDGAFAGMVAGSMLALAANRQRFFYLRKGTLLGGTLGLGLTAIDWLTRTLQRESDPSITIPSSPS